MVKGLKSASRRLALAGEYLQKAFDQLAPDQMRPAFAGNPEAKASDLPGQIESLRGVIQASAEKANRIKLAVSNLNGQNRLALIGHKPKNGHKPKSARCTDLT